MTYVLYTDHKAGTKKNDGYKLMEAKNLLDAMAEADKEWNDDCYLMRIMEQDGKTERVVKGRDGFSCTLYTAKLARRSYGWHLNNHENAEGEHSVKRFVNRFFDNYEIA